MKKNRKRKKGKKKTRHSRGRSPKAVRGEPEGFALLGNKDTKSSSLPPSDVSPERLRMEVRAKRYEYQATARWLLMQEGQFRGLKYPSNFHRTAKCLYVSIGETRVYRNELQNYSYFAGLPVCGSVWCCAVCSAKIQEKRRVEIAIGMNWAYSNGKKCVMVTLTFPHYSWQHLEDILKHFAYALNLLRGGKLWTKIKNEIGFAGLIRSLEVTYGRNGWNAHSHEIWIIDEDADVEFLKLAVLQQWRKACIKAGLLDADDIKKIMSFMCHSVHVRDNARTGDYLAKQDDLRRWGADRELAKSNSKSGRDSGRHPFALLATAEWSNKDGQLFLEYAQAIIGRRQIFWSPGLRDKVGVYEVTDEELAKERPERANALAVLTSTEWNIIAREEARVEILDLAELRGWAGIAEWFGRRGIKLAYR